MRALILLALAAASLGFAQTTINAGGSGDQYYSPTTACIFSGSTVTNAPCISAYVDPTMGPPTNLRYGYAGLPFSYSIPAPNGVCDVALTFVEPNKTAAGLRVFTYTVQGQMNGPLDIFSQVGTKRPYTVSFPSLPVTTGTISIAFQPMVGNAVVSTISVTNCHVPIPPLTLNCVAPITCLFNSTTNQYTVSMAPQASLSICPMVPANTVKSTWLSTVMVYLEHLTSTGVDCLPRQDPTSGTMTVVVDSTGTPLGIYLIDSQNMAEIFSNAIIASDGGPGLVHVFVTDPLQ